MFEERCVQPDGGVFELRLEGARRFRLRFWHRRRLLVEYGSEGGDCRKVLAGRSSAYAFRSVEQLRYDFERDAEDALRQG